MSTFEEKKHKRKEAVVLSYDQEKDEAPKIVAKGQGIIAENIIEKAKENDIPIQEDPSLMELLTEININQTIPEELFSAVAEVFSFIYQIDRKAGRTK